VPAVLSPQLVMRCESFEIGGIQPEWSGYAQEEHDRPRAGIVSQAEDVA
jgi:hypothetical protein